MTSVLRTLAIVSFFALAGCASSPTSSQFVQSPVATAPVVSPVTTLPTPAQQTAAARSTFDVAAYLDPAVTPMLNERSRNEAAGAQYNSLQFGRAGAPRNWQGDGASGVVTVGPYVPVNDIACRNFTHAVTVGGQTYTRKGQACRDAAGTWVVENSSIG